MTRHYDTPRGVLPRAEGYSKFANEYRFGPRNIAQEVASGERFIGIGGILKKAVLQPGVRVVEYHEENGYEYETYAIFDAAENMITTNYYGCPRSSSHHVGSTCGCCGLKD